MPGVCTPAHRSHATGSLPSSGAGGPRARGWFTLAGFQRALSQLFHRSAAIRTPASPLPHWARRGLAALIFAAVAALCSLYLTACAQYPATAKVCYERDGKTVCVSVADNAVQLHAASDTGLSGDFSLPLPRKEGYAK